MFKKLLFAALFCIAAVTTVVAEPVVWNARSEGDSLTLTAEIAGGHYLYANELLKFDIRDNNGKAVKLESTPATVEKHDELMGGKVKVFLNGRHIWRFRGTPPFSGTVDYQVCRDATGDEPALCLMPETFDIAPKSGDSAATVATGDRTLLDGFTQLRKTEGLLNTTQFKTFLTAPTGDGAAAATSDEGMFAGATVWLVMLLAIIGGLGLNLTPCVLPMIPINLAIIGADGAGRETGFRRGLAYGLGMAAAYGLLGIAVILTGARFGELNSSSVFNFVIAGVFALLATAMFGAFNLDFSGKFRISPKKLKGGKTVVAFVMGALAALLAGACVAPVIIGVLLFSTELYNSGNVFALGLPFLLGVGMALPWPLAGAGLGVLPKPGKFMVVVKYVFGGIIALAALWYAWVGYTLLPGDFSAEREIDEMNRQLVEAQTSGKPVLIDFWATWCKNCLQMQRDVLPDPEVQELLKEYVFIKFQAEDLRDPEVRAILDRYEIQGLPTFVILKAK